MERGLLEEAIMEEMARVMLIEVAGDEAMAHAHILDCTPLGQA